MAKTLLEIVQDILSEMGADPVNNISDTVESEQTANIVRSVFEGMVSNRNWPTHRKLIVLESSNDLSKPTHLKIPFALKELSGFTYDKRRLGDVNARFEAVTYKEPLEFLAYTNLRNSSEDTIKVVYDFEGARLLIRKDMAPMYWTSFDDTHIVCDSYNSEVDDTLQSNKTQCLAYILPQWIHSDTYVPDIPEEAFPALIAEAKSTAFLSVKETANQKAEQVARKQQAWLSRKSWQTHGGIAYPDYGRKR